MRIFNYHFSHLLLIISNEAIAARLSPMSEKKTHIIHKKTDLKGRLSIGAGEGARSIFH